MTNPEMNSIGNNEEVYVKNAKGHLVPETSVKPADRLIDQAVKTIFDQYAIPLNAEIARFRGHCIDDIATLQNLLREDYGIKKGGVKGNVTLMSYDGCRKIELQQAQHMTFDTRIQIAKELIDECLTEWADAGTHVNIKTIIMDAFEVNQQGKMSREKLLGLRRHNFDHPKWQTAMTAIADSITFTGKKAYVRFYHRPDCHAPWEALTIDIASAADVTSPDEVDDADEDEVADDR
ncbi:MAG: DUF3164 family protein [Alphaproteobacteria bacterium]|nr:DUF3164 family protein [Alphaproteobacteria bacterium]